MHNYKRITAYILIVIVMISCMGFRSPQFRDGSDVLGKQRETSNISEILQSKPGFLMCSVESVSRNEVGRPTHQVSRLGRCRMRSMENIIPVPMRVIQSLILFIVSIKNQIFWQVLSSMWILKYIHHQDGEKQISSFLTLCAA